MRRNEPVRVPVSKPIPIPPTRKYVCWTSVAEKHLAPPENVFDTILAAKTFVASHPGVGYLIIPL